jgi:hypothetical protein
MSPVSSFSLVGSISQWQPSNVTLASGFSTINSLSPVRSVFLICHFLACFLGYLSVYVVSSVSAFLLTVLLDDIVEKIDDVDCNI